MTHSASVEARYSSRRRGRKPWTSLKTQLFPAVQWQCASFSNALPGVILNVLRAHGQKCTAPRRYRRRRLRRAGRRAGAREGARPDHARRSHEPSPVSTAALPGRDGWALARRHRSADPRDPAAAEEPHRAPLRSHGHRPDAAHRAAQRRLDPLRLPGPRDRRADELLRARRLGEIRAGAEGPGRRGRDPALRLAFEAAEKESEPERRRQLLTFVVVGGGPTGVELAGAIAELARHVLASDFRHIDPRQTRIILVEAGPRVLPMFPEDLAAKAVRQLETLGVSVRTRAKVTDIDESGLHLAPERIAARTVLWAAGVQPTGLTRRLGAPLDPAGRVIIEPDLTLPGHPEAYAIGDMAVFLHQGGKPLPGVAPVAIQMGSHAARNIFRTLDGAPRVPFHYVDRGSMATIGRSAAIAQIGRLRLDGFVAWLAWLVVHL